MSEQAVLGGVETSVRRDCDIPRSHDAGVANAAVVRLYGARFNSARGYDCALYKVYARTMGGSAIEYDRVYGEVARGAAQINCGVRCRNRGVAAGLYSQPGLVSASGIVVMEDGYVIGSYGDGSAGRSRARGVSGVDGVNATWARGDDDIDTRLKCEVDGGVIGADVDPGTVGVAPRGGDKVARPRGKFDGLCLGGWEKKNACDEKKQGKNASLQWNLLA